MTEQNLEPTDDTVPDGTQIPMYHPAVAEAVELAELEQGDAGVGDVILEDVD